MEHDFPTKTAADDGMTDLKPKTLICHPLVEPLLKVLYVFGLHQAACLGNGIGLIVQVDESEEKYLARRG